MRTIAHLAVLPVLLLLAVNPAGAQDQPADLQFGGVFGYEIGQSVDAARAHARDRGERLFCREIDLPELPGRGVCSPESALMRDTIPPADLLLLLLSTPPLPAYTLYLIRDSVQFFGVTLGTTPELSRARVEAHFDSLGARVMEGRSAEGVEAEHVAWMGDSGVDYAELQCRVLGGTPLCTVHIGRVDTPEDMDRRLTMWRRRAPIPLNRNAPGA